ncbi:MAG: hypothetical protein SFU86_04820 [Pirellulaceae bacterium]|nr:hypothetical protein [Pirellulaceae bacterium]
MFVPLSSASNSGRRPRAFAAHFHLLGCVDFEDCLSLQRRLAYDALTRADGRIVILIGEHPPLITLGRGGSRRDVRLSGDELAARGLEVRHISRGGGAILHRPGQLAIYPIVPLDWHGWSVGEHLRRLSAGLAAVLAESQIRATPAAGGFSLLGKTGVLAALGVAVRGGVTTHGAYFNVNPDMRDYPRVHTLPGRSLTSLLTERLAAVKMTTVRTVLVSRLAEAFACVDPHVHAGHPHLSELPADHREFAA